MSSDTSEDEDVCSKPKKKSEDSEEGRTPLERYNVFQQLLALLEYDNSPFAFHEQYFPRRTLSEMSEEMEKPESIEQTRSPKFSMSQDLGSVDDVI